MARARKVMAVALGAVVVVFAAVMYLYQRDIQQARARVASGSEIVHTPCGPIEYAVTGEGAPLLVVHGAGGGFDQGLDFTAPLAKRGFRIIAMSRFGYLRTPLPAEAGPAAQADAHACLLDALQVPRAAVVVLQFLLTLFTGEPNARLRTFSLSLAAFIYQIVAFITFNSDERPFPFSPWPEGAPRT